MQSGKPIPKGEAYQKGERYGIETLREAVFMRDKHTCHFCGRNSFKDGAVLHAHHMLYWKGRHGNKLSELSTCCEKCHTPANHQKGGKLWGVEVKLLRLEGAAFMNIVRWQMYNEIKDKNPNIKVHITYGTATKLARATLAVEKTHANDAFAMGEFHPQKRAEAQYFQKVRRNDRILEKFYDAIYIDARTGEEASGKELFSGRSKRNKTLSGENLHKFRAELLKKGCRALSRKTVDIQPGDYAVFKGERLIVHGTHTSKKGDVNVEFVAPAKNGQKSASLKKVAIIKKRFDGGWKPIIS